MPYYEREEKLLAALMENETVSLADLSRKLFVSMPTLRRDLIKLEQKGKILRTHGGAKLIKRSADEKIPFYWRQEERYEEKTVMAKEAIKLVKEGDTVMLDGSTSAYTLVPLLADIPHIVVITSSARSSYLLGELGVNTICTGGRMIPSSLSYIGSEAEHTLRQYNADILFFSCRGVSPTGMLTDNSHEENALRRIMMQQSAKTVCLCDSSKIGNTCLHNLCHVTELDAFICDQPIPSEWMN